MQPPLSIIFYPMTYHQPTTCTSHKSSLLALSPLMVFLCLYLVTSVIINDFYKVPITVAFLVSTIYAIAITRGESMESRINIFSSGAAHKNIMIMIWIFILAGAFAQAAKSMGAIHATVNLTLQLLPDNLLLPGIFLAACFISLSIGTSVGTIVALTPVAVGIAERTSVGIPFMVAVVVGGAFFGDNLSFISDTTIAATKTMGCKMRDKFRINSVIAIPAAIVVLLIYVFMGADMHVRSFSGEEQWYAILPYLAVLVLAVLGVNVMIVLTIGILLTGAIGLPSGQLTLWQWFEAMGDGIMGMGELIIVTMMAGGMMALIRHNGGMDYLIRLLTKRVKGRRGAELSIAALVGLSNVCTANNTIAIITAGPIANEIAGKYHLDKRKCACILDTFSCLVQGIIPYGAQLLMAAGLSQVSPAAIIGYLYYPVALGIFALLSILLNYPRSKA